MTTHAAHQPFHVQSAGLFDLADLSLVPPPSESCALDVRDAAVRRVALAASAAAGLSVLGGFILAYGAG